jgi:hypothetical protein
MVSQNHHVIERPDPDEKNRSERPIASADAKRRGHPEVILDVAGRQRGTLEVLPHRQM